MNRQSFRQRLKAGPLLLDGAMGTVLHVHGLPIDECFEAVNLHDPALVAKIHQRYIDAGADIIETNSFGANRFKLKQHGLEDQIEKINRQAVSIARRVIQSSFKQVLLAGSVGPLGVRLAPLGRVKEVEAEHVFSEQISALTQAPHETQGDFAIDLLILETISELKELELAVRAARSIAPDLPVVGLITFTRDDRTILGDTPDDVADVLSDLDLDAMGVNCSSGPVQALRILTSMKKRVPHMPLAAVPNAGWPQHRLGGRVHYPATPDYFAEYTRAFVQLGANLIGGCCGTDESHIAAMRIALDNPRLFQDALPMVSVWEKSRPTTIKTDRPTRLGVALEEGQFVVTVEMSPPRGITAQKLIAGAHSLKESGVTHIDVADSPLARMRMSAWAAAHLVQTEVGLEAILHFPTRGRNLLRVQGDLLAAHALNIRNLMVVMGDPTQIGDYPEATDNYDIVPSGLIQLIKSRLNYGLDQAGRKIDQPTRFTVGCGINLEPADMAREMRLINKKMLSGADFAVTQPIFNPKAARGFVEAFQEKFGKPMLPIIAGIQPLYSPNNAEFLHNEVPGITIPDEILQRMKQGRDPKRIGVRIAQEIVEDLRPVVQGIYMVPAFGRYDLVADVLEILDKE